MLSSVWCKSMDYLDGILNKGKNNQCLKDISEILKDYVENIKKLCLFLQEKLQQFQTNLDSCLGNVHYDLSNTCCRDGILEILSKFWDLYHTIMVKGRNNVCPLLVNLAWLFCNNGVLVMLLGDCMGSHDHYLVYQA